MLVAMSLLVVIMMGLTMMFMQTQKAFKGGLRQVDVFEGGRSAMDLISHDLEPMVDAGKYSEYGSNLWTCVFQEAGYPRLIQLENGQPFRTNFIYDLFSISRIDSRWIATAYAVTNMYSLTNVTTSSLPSIGTLYRYSFETNTVEGITDNNVLFRDYTNHLQNIGTNYFTNRFTRVIDGVVHFKIRAYGGDALELTNYAAFPYTNITTVLDTKVTNRIGIPNTIEVELGVLEPETYQQIRSMPADVAELFFRSKANKVHIFRQQIPIRAASR
jgi:hypothetical protein